TAEEVADQLKIKPRTVQGLGIPYVRVGKGKGVRRYRQQDVDTYINLRVHYQDFSNEKKTKTARHRVKRGWGALGLTRPLTRGELQAIRVGNQGAGTGRTQ